MPTLSRTAGIAGVLAVLLAGCASPDGASPSTSASAGPPAATSPVPPPLQAAGPLPDDAVGAAVARLDDMAADLMARSGIPGMAVAVVHGGGTVYAKGFGVRDVRDPASAVDADTVFQLASLSKPVGSTVVAHEVTAGTVGWDTPVVSELPWFTLSDPAVTPMVTVGDLYAHRSGLPDHAGDLLEDLGYDRRYILERLGRYPLAPFRASYAYTNFGLTAGAEAVAAAAGKDWDQLSADVLYGPLGMTSTSSRFADYAARPDRAVGHIRLGDRYAPQYVRDADQEGPAGGVSSSVTDMARWLGMLLGDGTLDGVRIASPEALLPSLSPQSVASPAATPAARSGFYGFGFDVGTTASGRMQMSHSGAFELGAATNFVMIPDADVAIVVLTNATPAGVPETLTAQFADLVQFGEIRQDWWQLYHAAFEAMEQPIGSLVGAPRPASPAPPRPLAELAGEYRNDLYGPATVTAGEGGDTLTLALGATLRVPLSHWDGDTFTYQVVTENSPPGSIATARFDGDRLTLEPYAELDGVFVR